jgi:hypothetical protein
MKLNLNVNMPKPTPKQASRPMPKSMPKDHINKDYSEDLNKPSEGKAKNTLLGLFGGIK